MPVAAMRVTSKSDHPKTDKLFIYTFESPRHGQLTIVANLTNVYEPGDVAAIALLGTRLAEGEILPRKVFGVDSSGMALGKVDAEIDADLTAQFDADRTLSRYRMTFEVEIDGYYTTDTEAAARKALSQGKGALRHHLVLGPAQES